MPTAVTVLGSTGVVGRHTLEVIQLFPDAFEVVALAAGRNVDVLAEQVRTFAPRYVSVQDAAAAAALRERLAGWTPQPEIGVGEQGLREAAAVPAPLVVSAVVGARGLIPAWAALARGATLALANKETLVAAGDLVMRWAAARGGRLIPVDSEHSAIFQCLQGQDRRDLRKVVLTASGGPFRDWPAERLTCATPAEALRHPNWAMGPKITVDSATLMNKGLEVIEAHHLFQLSYDAIEVVVHPQSAVHGLAEFADGAVLAQLGPPDMRLPIEYALFYPRRPANPWPRLNLLQLQALTFEAPDVSRFPCLRLAYEAGRAGGFAPCVLNAANEVAVAAFLAGRIRFTAIPHVVESALAADISGQPDELDEIVEMDGWARRTAQLAVEKGRWGA
ncbi:MAG: 1-deoxy-D-xylulose-5-phosphate reductoisomerase [Alicyclobacillus sp.]|nr:1-deoxy-D-xylulose-5-phosphate reductoisomerase [Alicyclobacillus sp.]